MRDAAAELDHLEPARHLAHRVGEHLPVLRGERARELLAPCVDELADAEEDLGAARERQAAPGRERGLGGGDGCRHLLGGGEIDCARLNAGRGVVDRAASARLSGGALPADPVVDRGDGRGRFDQIRHLMPPRVSAQGIER